MTARAEVFMGFPRTVTVLFLTSCAEATVSRMDPDAARETADAGGTQDGGETPDAAGVLDEDAGGGGAADAGIDAMPGPDDGGTVDVSEGGEPSGSDDAIDPVPPHDPTSGSDEPAPSDPADTEPGSTVTLPQPAPAFSCLPASRATAEGGGRCADLKEAWTARGINAGYYPFRAKVPVEQYSGDYSGPPGQTFRQGATRKGVILQIVPAGAYVGLSSTGPWYDPPTGCFPEGQTCGAPYRAACRSSSPPLRPAVAGFRWGYAYAGASHMQGWFLFDPAKLEWAGGDASHPCALGPAGLDYEVHAACGAAVSCRGANPTCGHVNPCAEGGDDCGRPACGARSGGPLTPSAHRLVVARPEAAVRCTMRTPPHPSVRCLPNGNAADFFFVYPFGAYLYWAQNSTTKAWLHHGDLVQAYFHNRDAQGVLWDFVEVLQSGAPALTPASDGSGAPAACDAQHPERCTPCRNGGTCGWIQDVFLR